MIEKNWKEGQMTIKILGISGSPVKNSNTDRLVNAILAATGLETEFVKLSRINVRPCFACKKCVPDNVCKMKDDFQELAEKIKAAKALIIGAYTPYGQIDGFTKALLERFWSFRHQNNLLKGKLCATVLTGIDPRALNAINPYRVEPVPNSLDPGIYWRSAWENLSGQVIKQIDLESFDLFPDRHPAYAQETGCFGSIAVCLTKGLDQSSLFCRSFFLSRTINFYFGLNTLQ